MKAAQLFLNESKVTVSKHVERIYISESESVPGLKSITVEVNLNFISSGNFEGITDLEISDIIKKHCSSIKILPPKKT
jgi:hypothetical protein